MKTNYLILIALLPVIIGGCNLEEGSRPAAGADKTLTIVTWNVQALFDGVETGQEYQEYGSTAGWTAAKYQARLTAIGQAVERMGAPEVLALQEVENERVALDLAEGPLAKQGYRWTYFANVPGASLGLAVLSKIPLEQCVAHSITRGGETIPRPILEVTIRPESSPLALFICHWKSKAGNNETDEALRRAAARIISRRVAELEVQTPGIPAIVMGDLNESHDEFYRQSGALVSALLPDDPKAAELALLGAIPGHKDFLVLSGDKPPASRYFMPDAAVFYSPWHNDLSQGSYNYRNSWETIDHFLLTSPLFDAVGWEYSLCETVTIEPFVNAGGYPNSYNPRTGNGLSDHIPLRLTLVFAGNL